jgi:hypothetical protein
VVVLLVLLVVVDAELLTMNSFAPCLQCLVKFQFDYSQEIP